MPSAAHLLMCRVQGIFDVIFSALALVVLPRCLDRFVFEFDADGFVIRHLSSEGLIGNVTFAISLNGTNSEICNALVLKHSADYIKDNFENHIFTTLAVSLGFLILGVAICICTVIQSNMGLRIILVLEFVFEVLLLGSCVTFYGEAFCILEYVKGPKPYGISDLKFVNLLILLVPILICSYKSVQIILIFCLDRLSTENEVAYYEEERRDSEEQRLEMLNIALEKVASPNTAAVLVSATTQNNVLVIKSKEVSVEEIGNDIPSPTIIRLKTSSKSSKLGKNQFRKELDKTGRSDENEDEDENQKAVEDYDQNY